MKKKIKNIIGYLLGFFIISLSFLNLFVVKTYALTNPGPEGGSGNTTFQYSLSGGVHNPVSSSVSTPGSLINILVGIIFPILYGVVGVAVLGLISYAGFLFMVSNGDSNKINKAKSVLTGAFIGASIILLAYIISLILINAV